MLDWLSKNIFFPLWEIKDGSHRLKYLKELSASQWWSPEALRQQQWQRLCKIVKYAYDHCPYYRTCYDNLGFDGILRNWEDFRRLPLLTKRDIRDNTSHLLSSEFNRLDLVESKTGGSTGTALVIYCDKRCQELRNAAEMRSHYWGGREMGAKFAAIWGNPPIADTFKKKIRNLLLDRVIYLDTMNIDEKSVCSFVDRCRQEKPTVIFGHAHSIYILAIYLRKMSIEKFSLKGIITTSMMLLEAERQVIEDVFSCQVTNLYGCEEVGLIACECEQHKGLHLNTDHLIVEFLKEDGTEALPGEESNIIVTDLINHGMPFIRYRIEDTGIFSDQLCSCGRGLPIMERIAGRQADFLKRPDGSLVAGVSLVERTLTSIPGIEQMQLIQSQLDLIQVKIVKDKNFTRECEIRLKEELCNVFGQKVVIEISYVLGLDKTVQGKYRFAVCNIT